jgi:riboflavin kinase/FMN adenylyltransferase
MIIARSLGEVRRSEASVVTVGTFDGVHRAHQEIIREVVNRARMREGRSVVVSFDPHPREVVPPTRGGDLRILSTLEERIGLLEPLKVDLLLVLPFTQEFSRLGPEEFYRDYIVSGVGVSEVVVGYDHMFGHGRKAGAGDLVRMGKEFDFSVFAVHPFTIDGEAVSSTKIRRALGAGDLELARKMLGYRYSLSGSVTRGDARGAGLGFPTANIVPDSPRKLIPARGVYAVAVETPGGQFFGMMNVGVRPTVSDGTRETIEVHLFGFEGELYGKKLRVTFLRRLRDEKRFSGVEDLVAQLREDREQALRIVHEYRHQHFTVSQKEQ